MIPRERFLAFLPQASISSTGPREYLTSFLLESTKLAAKNAKMADRDVLLSMGFDPARVDCQ